MLDLGGIPESFVRRVPLSTWFRFRAVAEKLSAPLVVLTPCSVIGTFHSQRHLIRSTHSLVTD